MLILLLVIICILLLIYSFYISKKIHKINIDIDKENQLKQDQLNQLNNKIKEKENYANKINADISFLEKDLSDITEKVIQGQKDASSAYDKQTELSKNAFNNYLAILEKSYEEAEEEYNNNIKTLNESYSLAQDKILSSLEQARAELTKIEETRAAAIKARLKEQEIEENTDFYCLHIDDISLKDIAVLESIKPKLNNPRILSMLIWQTYWRTPMTNLCNNIIGKETKTGIYKITNILTKECYIGQAVDLANRFKEHAKCGLGIDTPSANKLYKAMQDYGIWNFSWEVIENCPRDQLNEKEKYYIKLYQSKEYGYNTLSGVNK